MKRVGLKNPMAAARLCCALEAELNELGHDVHVFSDMQKLDTAKLAAREKPVAPMHHYAVNAFGEDRAFWMKLTDRQTGQVTGLQAYRCDDIDTSLADWCVTYMIGVYMRRQELMVPSHSHPPVGSISERLTGRLVYHGEAWVCKSVKSRKVIEVLVRLGTVLAALKWQPDAVWALVSAQVARHGHHVISSYTQIERGFLRWTWASEGIDPVEYLVATDLAAIEAMIEEQLAPTVSNNFDSLFATRALPAT